MYSMERIPQKATIDRIKSLTHLSGLNYLQPKRLLDEGGLLMNAVGYKARPILEKLNHEGVEFSTN